MMETSGEITSHLTTGAAVVYGIQWLKACGWFPWLTSDTKQVNRAVSAVLAAIAAVGINWAYDASVDGGTLIIHGLSWSALATGAWEWFKQFTTQQLIWDGVVGPSKQKEDK